MNEFEPQLAEREFDFKKFFVRFLRYWYFVPIFLALSLLGAVYNYKTTTPLHKVSTQILFAGERVAGLV
jgi:tyrosine-protein kinase Etk/Wzc